MNLKLTLHLHDQAKPKVVETTHESFGFNEFGLRYSDMDLGLPITELFTNLKSFSVEGQPDSYDVAKSNTYQKAKSDKARKDLSGQWNVH